MSWPADAHDDAATGSAVNNIQSMQREKTAIYKYEGTWTLHMSADLDRENDKFKEDSLSALRKGITCQLLLRVCSNKNDTIPP